MTDQHNSPFDPIEDALAAIADGEMVVVVDDEDRENEGDLIMAAQHAKPEQVAFMIRHTSGILCTPLERDHARRLNLGPMVSDNDAPLSTAFTVSIDYRHGLTTGISAEERCNTVLALANSNAGAEDFVRPGHIFPLVSRDGGVLVRTGHTEAGTDLCRLAGLSPVGLLSELVNDDGTVQRFDDLKRFATEHGLKFISIADLIAYRQQREKLVERVGEFQVETLAGPARAITFRTRFDPTEHLALVYGKEPASSGTSTLVRIHRERVLDDVFGSQSGHAENLVAASLQRLREEQSGVFVYLRNGPNHLVPEQAGGEAFGEGPTASEAARNERWLEIGVGAQILRDLGVGRLRLLAGRQHNYVGLQGFGLELEDTVPFE